MNKVIKTVMISVLFYVGISFANRTIWELTGDDGNNQVAECGGYAECGYWFTYNDANVSGGDGVGGCIGTDFPDTGDDAETDEVSEWWYGKGGTVHYSYETGCTYAYPFAGIGFNWQKPKAPSPNAYKGDGLKIYYKLDAAAGSGQLWLELSTCDLANCANNDGSATGSGEYYVQLKANEDHLTDGFEVLWGDPKQPSWAPTKITPAQMAEAFVGLKFKWTELGGKHETGKNPVPPAAAKSIDLTLKKIELIGDWGTQAPVVNAGVKSPVQMNLAGKTIFFNGIASNATVEIIDLHGALVAKGNVGPKGNSINLSRLDNGVYIVRAKGEKLNITQKVVLK